MGVVTVRGRVSLAFLSAAVLTALPVVAATSLVPVTRGPYLQQGTPTSVIVRWRTAEATNSRVSFGAAHDQLTQFADDFEVTTEHEVVVTGLTADTTYYYAIGSTGETLAGGDAETFFSTSPATGTSRPTRIWVLGDSGTGDQSARDVRDAYYGFAGDRHTDLWLMLGDNAYPDGTDQQYQTALFDMYPEMLRKSVLWTTLGNHDRIDTLLGTWPYVDSFSLPEAGQAGGEPSGSELYYSFDYGNVHFVVLDSFESPRTPGSDMLLWLEQDLAGTLHEWVIVFWHHPPYSKGGHDSDNPLDSSGRMTDMRETVLPVLEAHGVDLVLAGHSHSYERSFLLDGHHGTSATLVPSMVLDPGDGRLVGDGVYGKAGGAPAPNSGAVYVVAGSSGKTSGGALNHPAMFLSLNRLGSVVLDIDGPVLTARFLAAGGAVADHFTMVKGGDGATCVPGVLVSNEADWRYLDDGTHPGAAWTASSFDDSGWASGSAQFGYGDGDEATIIGFGPDPANKYVTSYFRYAFDVEAIADLSAVQLRLLRDDGAVVYLNGAEVFRSNMPAGPVGTETLASLAVDGPEETTFHLEDIAPALVVSSTNILAVEVHQATPSSNDLSFDLELVGQFCSDPVDPDLIFADGFESGDTSAWSSARTDGGDLAVTAAAASEGAYGAALTVDDHKPLWVQYELPQAESSLRIKFTLDPNGLKIPNRLLNVFSGTRGYHLPVLFQLQKNGQDYQVRALIRADDFDTIITPWQPIADTPNVIEIDWGAASAAGADNGFLTLTINDRFPVTITGVDNDTYSVDSVRLGVDRPIQHNTSGIVYLDSFELRR